MKRSLAVAVLVLCALAPTRSAHATTVYFSSNARSAGSRQGGFFVLSINTLLGDTFTVDGVARPGTIGMGGGAPMYVIGVPTSTTSYVTTDIGTWKTLYVGNEGYSGSAVETTSSGGVFTAGSLVYFDVYFPNPIETPQPVYGWIGTSSAGGGGSPVPEPATAAIFALGLSSLGVFTRRR